MSSNSMAVPVKKYVWTRAGVWNWLGGGEALFSHKDPKRGVASQLYLYSMFYMGSKYLFYLFEMRCTILEFSPKIDF